MNDLKHHKTCLKHWHLTKFYFPHAQWKLHDKPFDGFIVSSVSIHKIMEHLDDISQLFECSYITLLAYNVINNYIVFFKTQPFVHLQKIWSNIPHIYEVPIPENIRSPQLLFFLLSVGKTNSAPPLNKKYTWKWEIRTNINIWHILPKL